MFGGCSGLRGCQKGQYHISKVFIGVTDSKSEVIFDLKGCLEAALFSPQVYRAIALLLLVSGTALACPRYKNYVEEGKPTS